MLTLSLFIGVARILSGWGTFFLKKFDDPFLVVAFKRRSKTTNWSYKSPHSKNVLKLTLTYTAWGCTRCAGGALTNYFFLRPGGCRCTHWPGCLCNTLVQRFSRSLQSFRTSPSIIQCHKTDYLILADICRRWHGSKFSLCDTVGSGEITT